ncbi:hypothetical protein HWV62_19467 [Athelia sp. TMB]|nr:hypothetical protein HWV62_19467 [Athelia sp. TMB]
MGGRALRTVSRLPARVSGGRGSGRNNFSPIAGETPIAVLRVQVLGCKDLLAKDKNGFSDPFVVVSVLNTRFHTPVLKRTTSPNYVAATATFEFPLYMSLAHQYGSIELVVWDKDMLKKEYLGEAALALDDWFRDEASGVFSFDDPANQPYTVNLVSSRASTPATGTVQIKVGFVNTPGTLALMEFKDVYKELVRRSRPSLVSAPPTEGIGTIRSHQHGPAYEDDGGISSDDSDNEAEPEQDDEDEGEEEDNLPPLAHLYIDPAELHSSHSHEALPNVPPLLATPLPEPAYVAPPIQAPIPVTPPILINSGASALHTALSPLVATSAKPPSSPVQKIGKILRRPGASRSASTNSSATSGAGTSSDPTTPMPSTPQVEDTPKKSKHGREMSITLPPPRSSSSGYTDPSTPTTPGTANGGKKGKFRRSWSHTTTPNTPGNDNGGKQKNGKNGKPKKGDFNFSPENDILGIVMLEIQSASDLPRIKNMTRTGWDMDPFVVISFGKKVFRTRIIRHSLNPVWDEKLLFHVRAYESSFKVQLTVLDWDKLSSNDHVGDAGFSVAELMAEGQGPQVDEKTGLYAADADGKHAMKEFRVPLTTAKEMAWEAKHNPVITFRAKYQPYAALRQQFWRQYLKQYDTGDTGLLSHLELTSMLDSLGSTLSAETVSSFFTRNGKRPTEDELTIDEAVVCLETEIGRPREEKKRISPDDVLLDYSAPATPGPGFSRSMSTMQAPQLAKLDFSGPGIPPMEEDTGADEDEDISRQTAGHPMYATEYSQQPLSDAAAPGGGMKTGFPSYPGTVVRPSPGPHQYSSAASSDAEDYSSGSNTNSYPFTPNESTSAGGAGEEMERVINVKNCPLCHRPRLNKKAEVDIVTHLAVCASGDWAKIDRIVVGNFVTASQAQRKWYTKIISKVSSGDYRLGANSANIIVQNRMTGQLEEEKMQVYVRLGIRLLYKGAKSRMEGARARRLLKSLSIKQGLKYDDPASARDIKPFIDFHRLKIEEIRDPIESFKTFNEFFYRKLKPEARPVEEPDNPHRIVSGADCRLMTFESVSEATRLWIKGREFTIARLVGDTYKGQVERYNGGAVAVFRLAPQDYHRFHSPVDGTIGNMTYIPGEYYTVNPQAIRTTLDVYGENVRKIVPIDSPVFGRVMAVCVGAMMVGSIKTTLNEGDAVARGQEFGYFAFGGSTIVLLFEKGSVEWDEDLLINGRASLETLVRVGMGIGRSRRQPSP